MPALTIGIAQQQYSLGFMVVGGQACVGISPFFGNRLKRAVLR